VTLGATRTFVRRRTVLSNLKSDDHTKDDVGAHVKLKYPSLTPTAEGVNSVAPFHDVSLKAAEYQVVGAFVTKVLQSNRGSFDFTHSSLRGALLVTNTFQDLFVAVIT